MVATNPRLERSCGLGSHLHALADGPSVMGCLGMAKNDRQGAFIDARILVTPAHIDALSHDKLQPKLST